MMLASAGQAPLSQGAPAWSGLYFGTSVGYGATSASSRYRNTSNTKNGDSYNSADRYSGTGYSNNGTYSSSNSYQEFENSWGSSQGSEWNGGALVDLYLGASTQFAPRLVAGVQVEGGLSQMLFQSTIRKHHRRSNGRSEGTYLSTDSDGDTYRTESSGNRRSKSTTHFPAVNSLELDWMVSVIGKAGYLATPTTLVYGLGGWSYGHFNADGLSYSTGHDVLSDFGSHGLTVGAGLEQKISQKWSLKAEYRYTHFGKEDFSTKSRFGQKSTSAERERSRDIDSCCDGETYTSRSTDSRTSTGDNDSNYTSKGYFENNMHVGRIGVTRYFDLGN